MKKQLITSAMVILGMAYGCAGPPKTQIDRIYSGLSENLPRLDPSILQGRTILIDPGHGGHFRGTVGLDSLEESRVNLGVSLHLWGLLREVGADAILTRSAERDFLTEMDSSLVTDLQARVSLACSLKPDIFVSIHHNAQSKREPSFNLIETYYRAGDPASMDLAFTIHRHLMRNLGISTGEVRQGNYYILRNVQMPAIIGEASYLTHPSVEKKLRLSEKQRLEAEAYFLGILEYFHRGVPYLMRLSPSETTLTSVPTIVYRAEDTGGLGIDPDALEMVLNNRKVEPVFNRLTGRITYRPSWDTPNGPYELSLIVRNLLGNSSHRAQYYFMIDFPPKSAVFDPYPKTLPPGGGIIRVQSRLLDGRGLVIADGTPVSISINHSETQHAAVVREGRVEFPVFVPVGAESLYATIRCRERLFPFVMRKAAESSVPFQGAFLVDGSSGKPVTEASIVYGDSVIQTGSQAGLYLIPIPQDTFRIRIQAPGYRSVTLSHGVSDTIRLSPWFDGQLSGKRFLIDPEGGSPKAAGSGKLGLSGAHVNLQVARYLASYLMNAGAETKLTRYSEEVRTPQDVVLLANRFRADRYVEIRHRSPAGETGGVARTYFFPGSRLGADLAQKIAFSLSGLLNLPLSIPGEAVTFPLQQTACPAVIVDGPSLDDINEEIRLGEAWYQRFQAYSIFLGILAHYEVAGRSSLVVSITGAEDPGNWLIVVDDTWKLLTNPEGTAVFYALSEGSHSIEIQRENNRFFEQVDLSTDRSEELIFNILKQ